MYVQQSFLDLKFVIEVFEDETLLPAGCKGIRREGGRRPLLVAQLPGVEKYSWEIQSRNTVEKYSCKVKRGMRREVALVGSPTPWG